MLTRTVADTAAILDVLAGYEPGDATWAPPPSRAVRRWPPRREPGRLRIAVTTLPPIARRDRRPDLRARRRRGRRAAALARARGRARSTRRGRQDGLAELFGVVFSTPDRALDRLLGARRRPGADGRGHGADELGDLLDGRSKLGALEQQRAVVQLQAFARQLVAWLAPYDALLTPGAGRAPAAARHARHGAPRPDGDVHPLGPVHAVHAGLQRQRPAGDLAAALRGRGRAAARRAARRRARPARSACWRSRRQLEGAQPWAERRAPVGEWVS